MIPLLLAAALQVGPPAPPVPDQTKPATKETRSPEERLRIIEGTMGDALILTAGGAIDLYGTELIFHRKPGEYREGNGTGFNAGARVAGKALLITVTAFICRELREDGHHRAARVLAFIGGGGWGAAGAANMWRAR